MVEVEGCFYETGIAMLLADFAWVLLMNPFGIPIVAIVCVFLWLTVSSIAEEVSKVYRHRANTDLKSELVARGLPSDEIVRGSWTRR